MTPRDDAPRESAKDCGCTKCKQDIHASLNGGARHEIGFLIATWGRREKTCKDNLVNRFVSNFHFLAHERRTNAEPMHRNSRYPPGVTGGITVVRIDRLRYVGLPTN